MFSGEIESVNLSRHLGIRPLCPCCGGDEIRKKQGKFKHTKSVSRAKNVRSHRGDAKLSGRDKRSARSDKF